MLSKLFIDGTTKPAIQEDLQFGRLFKDLHALEKLAQD